MLTGDHRHLIKMLLLRNGPSSAELKVMADNTDLEQKTLALALLYPTKIENQSITILCAPTAW